MRYAFLKICCLFLALIQFNTSLFAQPELKDLKTLSKNGHVVRCIAFSPDGKILATGGTDAQVVLWDLNSYSELRTLKGHNSTVQALEFDVQTGWLYSASHDRRLIAWNIKTGKIEFDIKAHEREVNDLRIDYFRGNIVTSSNDKTISTWDKSTGKLQKTFYGHEQDVKSISISSDWQFLYSTGQDFLLKTWDLNNGAELKSLKMEKAWLNDLSRSPANDIFASGGNDKVIKIWDDNVYSPIREILGQKGAITALDISGNGKILAAGSYDKSVFLYNIEDGKQIASTIKHKAEIVDLKFSWDGSLLATAELGTNIRLFETKQFDPGVFSFEFPSKNGREVARATPSSKTGSSSASSATSTFNDDVDFNPLELGKNHLLLIGINDYEHWPRLTNAMNDISDVKRILTDKYQFRDENIYTVANDKATLENIHNAFQDLRAKVGEKDNVLIFYSGHGFYDRDLDEGYWIPVDAASGKTTDYLPNSNLLKYIKALDSKHIFLVADACFSGSLFSPSTRGYVENVEKYKSRWALTSGRLEFVSDGNYGARNSPFTSYFLKYLSSNEKEEVAVSELIQYVKVSVSNNSDQTPIGSPLKNVGDEGGEFIFRKK